MSLPPLSVPLSRRSERMARSELAEFLVAIRLLLLGGMELSSAWNEGLLALGSRSPLLKALHYSDGESFLDHLAVLSQTPPTPEAGPWFRVLAEVYRQGAPLSITLNAFLRTLQDIQRLEWESHRRELPAKTQIILMLFFLPPFLLLMAYPLLQAMRL